MADAASVKARFIKVHGYWNNEFQMALDADADYLEAHLDMMAVALSGPLDRKTCEFVLIAANASVCHLNPTATAAHIASALKHGATRNEIIEVLQCASLLGMHGYMMGIPMLFEKLRASGDPKLMERFRMGDKANAIKKSFSEKRGYWSPLLEDLLASSPDFWEAYTRYSSVPWTKGTLPPKVKEFMYIAIDVSTTHLHEAGTNIHLTNALKYGATPEEVIQVMQLISCIGVQTFLLGVGPMFDKLGESAPDKL